VVRAAAPVFEQLHLFSSSCDAVRRCFRQPSFQGLATGSPGLGAALYDIDVAKTHLAVPGSRNGRPCQAVTGKHDGAIVHHRYFVRTLHRLATWEPAKTRDVPGAELCLCADVHEIHGFLSTPCHHGLHAGDVEIVHSIFLRQTRRIRLCRSNALGGGLRQGHPICPGFELIARQDPA